MSISSSIYVGSTGIMAQQQKMSVISDNIANVSTVGFKSSRLLFQNLLSQELAGASVNNQIGKGVSTSSILQNMQSGSLEETTNATDMAIGGKGFFLVTPKNSTDIYYTKAGSFRFDETGYLRDPAGNVLQGHKLPPKAKNGNLALAAQSASLEPVHLATDATGQSISFPEPTTKIQMVVNLSADARSGAEGTNSPYTGLFDTWDANNADVLPPEASQYSSSLLVYDQAGEPHPLTVYFDPAGSASAAENNGQRTWEYLVTIPPAEDKSALNSKKGVLMTGTLTFNAGGKLVSMSSFTGTTDDTNTWQRAALSPEGLPLLQGSINASPLNIALDFGLSSETASWNSPEQGTTLADLDTDMANLPSLNALKQNALGSTSYSSNSGTIYQNQDGYAQGFLKSVNIDAQGILFGNYSNGQQQALYQIPLADFMNPQGLSREGGNLLAATKESGVSRLGWAGQENFGRIAPSALEQSNVDLGTEFVDMIISQKAFDANSKVITTSDQVVQTAIQMKRA